jgi:hypothetical protein
VVDAATDAVSSLVDDDHWWYNESLAPDENKENIGFIQPPKIKKRGYMLGFLEFDETEPDHDNFYESG